MAIQFGCLVQRPYRQQLLFEMRRIRAALVENGTLQRTETKGVYTIRRATPQSLLQPPGTSPGPTQPPPISPMELSLTESDDCAPGGADKGSPGEGDDGGFREEIADVCVLGPDGQPPAGGGPV